MYCACPYFADFGRCKHLWAAVLEADRRGVLGEAVAGGALRLYRDADPDDEREVGPLAVSPARAPAAATPPWQEYLTDIRHSLETKRLKAPLLAPGIRNPLRDRPRRVAGSPARSCWNCISRSRKKNGDWTVNKEFRIAPSQVGSLPDPVDAEAIASILGGQEYYVYTYAASSGVASRKAVPHALALRLIPLVAGTGRLFTRKISLAGIAAARLGRRRAVETLARRPAGRSRSVENHRLAAPRRRAHGVDRADGNGGGRISGGARQDRALGRWRRVPLDHAAAHPQTDSVSGPRTR